MWLRRLKQSKILPSYGMKCSQRMFCTGGEEKPVFITTPIFYVNDKPHIGHLYTALLADSISRWFRMKGRKVFLSTGTDEHGLKIQKEAEMRKISEKEHCDKHSKHFQELFDTFGIQYDRFVRTTDEDHKVAVNHLWKILEDKQYFEHGTYSGWYCTSDEQFLTDDQVNLPTTEGGVATSKESGREVERTEEDNILFDLSKQKPHLEEWVKHADIVPSEKLAMIENLVRTVPGKLSVTRDANRVKWGIKCPSNPSQTLYVWFDALTNYLTVTGYPNESFKKIWPPDYQFFGKDIVSFHCVYWPAFLKAAGLPLPKKMVSHSHWTRDRVKMSKSLKNVVDPIACLETFSVDMLRFYLLLEGGLLYDGDFSFSTLKSRVNGDLCNHYGNLLSRSTSKLINPHQTYPNRTTGVIPGMHQTIITALETITAEVEESYESVYLGKGIRSIFSIIRNCNVFFEENTPWKLAKQGKTEDLEQVLYNTYEVLRISSILLQPIIPEAAGRALDKLNIPKDRRSIKYAKLHAHDDYVCSTKLPEEPVVLFEKIKE